MKISIVIPAHNEEKYISRCLSSIEKYKDEIFEIIVINNASIDSTTKIVEGFPFVRLVYEPQKGLPHARNKGLSEAQGEIIAFIDADTEMPKGWVKKLIKEFEKNKNLISISGPYVYYDVSIFQKGLVWTYWLTLAWPLYFVTGYMILIGNFAAKKDALIKIGGFNKDIPFYGDDTDISKKLSKIGKVKFSQTFYMFSSARRLQSEGILKTAYKYIINSLWVIFKNKPRTVVYKDIR
jgi:glycosyltransferase involved in cell wall biosynthesis